MDLAALAERQLADYDRHRPGLVFAGDAPSLSIDQAYDVQLRVATLRRNRGESVAGYKVGCVSETVRRQLGLTHPVFGHIFATELHASGCGLDPAGYDGLAIEGEFAVRVTGADSICPPFPVIELHNYVFRASAGQTAQELIANNAIHAGVVLPPDHHPPADSGDDPVTVWINGELRGTAAPPAIPASLRMLRERLAHFGLTLQNGQLVLTGSPLPLYSVQPGDRIEVRSRCAIVTANIYQQTL